MTIGLTLGGGGARGISHIVVLDIIDELGLEVSAISGTSIGAIMGMGYASGMSGKELREYSIETFADGAKIASTLWELRPSGLHNWLNPKSYSIGQIDATKILSLFTPIDTMPKNIEDLKIPLTVVATNFYEGTDAVYTKGDLKTAVAASMAIPMVFKPVLAEGKVAVDGGVSNPVPFDHLPKSCTKIIAVDVTGAPTPKSEKGSEEPGIPNGIETLVGANQISMRAIFEAKMIGNRRPDIVIEPPINKFQVLDFLKTTTILRLCDSKKDAIKRQIETLITP